MEKVEIQEELRGKVPHLFLKGELTLFNAEEALYKLKARVERASGPLVICMSQLKRIDSSGISVLMRIYEKAKELEIPLRFRNPTAAVKAFLEFLPFDPSEFRSLKEKGERLSPVERVGDVVLALWEHLVSFIAFTAESLSNSFLAPLKGKRVDFQQAIEQIEAIGLRALPIVGLISFIIGSIMAFQAASQLRQFGATEYIAPLVGVALTRELGPLLTAILVAGRSGSAIAAEIGTMRVTEEVDALRTMGMNPNRILVAPKLLGTLVSVPCLTVISDVVGMAGGFIIGVFALGIGYVTYYENTRTSLLLSDITTGLVKSFIFGLIIVLVGCRQGFLVKGGGEEVGKAATISVVRSIELIIAADLLFTALFYYFV